MACLEVLTTAITPTRRITSSCDHDPLICSSCRAQFITTQLDSKIWNQIECPTCNARLDYQDVRAFATKSSFKRYAIGILEKVALLISFRYDNLATLEAMSALPDFRRCLVPGCEWGQIHFGGAAQPIMACTACLRKTYYTHEMEWHEGRTYEEIDEQLAETKKAEREANAAYLAENTKTCPNVKCGRPIEKNGGSQHMTCELLPRPQFFPPARP